MHPLLRTNPIKTIAKERFITTTDRCEKKGHYVLMACSDARRKVVFLKTCRQRKRAQRVDTRKLELAWLGLVTMLTLLVDLITNSARTVSCCVYYSYYLHSAIYCSKILLPMFVIVKFSVGLHHSTSPMAVVLSQEIACAEDSPSDILIWDLFTTTLR